MLCALFLPELAHPTLGLKELKTKVVETVEQNVQFCFLESRNVLPEAGLWFVFLRIQVSKEIFMNSINTVSVLNLLIINSRFE